MAKERFYTIVVRRERVEVSEAVYYAYHKARESERYRNRVIGQTEMSLERFQEERVGIEYKLSDCLSKVETEVVRKETRKRLYLALEGLEQRDQFLIRKLFFEGMTEQVLAMLLGISQQAVNKRKLRILKRLRKILE